MLSGENCSRLRENSSNSMVAVRRNMFQVEGKNMAYVRRKNVIKIVRRKYFLEFYAM